MQNKKRCCPSSPRKANSAESIPTRWMQSAVSVKEVVYAVVSISIRAAHYLAASAIFPMKARGSSFSTRSTFWRKFRFGGRPTFSRPAEMGLLARAIMAVTGLLRP